MEKLKQIECDPKCGFMVRSHSENEVLKVAGAHAKSVHQMHASIADLKGMMKMV